MQSLLTSIEGSMVAFGSLQQSCWLGECCLLVAQVRSYTSDACQQTACGLCM